MEKEKEAERQTSSIGLPDPMQKPKLKGEKGGACPECGGQTVARQQRGTGKLYFGCETYMTGCRFNGCRDIP
jgi:ssDNA-binding Zn-finger/Zn-ribbon topoisomerase 1